MEAIMHSVYLLTAVVGGTFLVVQTALLFVGGDGGDGDVDVDSDFDGDESQATFKVLSFKTLVAFITFFGLTGLASSTGGLAPIPTLLTAIAAGVAALYIVAYLMVLLTKLEAKGNVDLRNAVGSSATVYLTVPADNSGAGKVIVSVQGRRLECKAVTSGEEIPTGAEVTVVGTTTSDTLAVQLTERS